MPLAADIGQQMSSLVGLNLPKPERLNSLPVSKKAHHWAFSVLLTCNELKDLGNHGQERGLDGASWITSSLERGLNYRVDDVFPRLARNKPQPPHATVYLLYL